MKFRPKVASNFLASELASYIVSISRSCEGECNERQANLQASSRLHAMNAVSCKIALDGRQD